MNNHVALFVVVFLGVILCWVFGMDDSPAFPAFPDDDE